MLGEDVGDMRALVREPVLIPVIEDVIDRVKVGVGDTEDVASLVLLSVLLFVSLLVPVGVGDAEAVRSPVRDRVPDFE